MRILMCLVIGSALLFVAAGCSKKGRKSSENTESARQGGAAGDGSKQGDGSNQMDLGDLPVLSPRSRFQVDFAKKSSGGGPKINRILVNPDGTRAVVSDDSQRQTEVWQISGEAKRLQAIEGAATGISDDGTLLKGFWRATNSVELETGKPTKQAFVGTSFDGINGSVDTMDALYRWSRSGDQSKPNPFRIFRQLPSQSQGEPLAAGDDDRVALAPAVNGGRELVFGVPSQNKIRVFDFSTRSVVREFALAEPRVSQAPGGYISWSAFAVSPDGKWIAAKRQFGGKNPPIELFDSTGALVTALPPKSVWEHNGAFVPGRDLYVAQVYGTPSRPLQSYDIASFNMNRKTYATVFRGHKNLIKGLAISANGKVMVTGDYDGEVCVWDLGQLK